MKVTLKSIQRIKKNKSTKVGADESELLVTSTKGHSDSYTDLMVEELFNRVFEVVPMEKDDKVVRGWFVVAPGPVSDVEWNVHRSWLDEVD